MKARAAAALVALGVGLPLFPGSAPSLAGVDQKSFSTLRVSVLPSTLPTDLATLSGTFFGIDRAVCSTLVAYPDRWGKGATRLVPEVAVALPSVSKDGRTYRFTIRSGFRFSTGQKVTAKSFADAINRDLNPQLASPAASYLHQVVGADDVLEGRAPRASGVRARGRKLVLKLERRTKDFLPRLTLPPFCPVPPNTPVAPGALKAPPASGPYYYASYEPRRTLVMKRNRFYGGKRAHRPTQIVWTLGVPADALRLEWERGDTDVAFLSPITAADVPGKYGINRRRFWKISSLSVGGLVFNNERPLFRNNPQLRKAINYLIDRRSLRDQLGVLSGVGTDQMLSTRMPGFRNAVLYPLSKPNVSRARRLAKGHTGSGKAIILAANVTGGAQNRALILQAELRTIGIDASIETDNPLNPRVRTRGTSWDIADVVTLAPYADPGAALGGLLDGRLITEKGNTNIAYFNKGWVNRRLDRAAKLTGKDRLRAYGRLDIDVMRREAPVAVYTTFAWNAFVSSRVGCVVLHPIFQISWGSICRRGG